MYLLFGATILYSGTNNKSSMKDYHGEYVGSKYTFVVSEDGFDIKTTNDCKWYIVNNALVVHSIKDGETVNKFSFEFVETDSTYLLITDHDTYVNVKD
jgi:hypothetical protein